jgi:hypothetical protein
MLFHFSNGRRRSYLKKYKNYMITCNDLNNYRYFFLQTFLTFKYTILQHYFKRLHSAPSFNKTLELSNPSLPAQPF